MSKESNNISEEARFNDLKKQLIDHFGKSSWNQIKNAGYNANALAMELLSRKSKCPCTECHI